MDERQQLLKVSRECLEHYFNTGKHFDCSEKNLSDNLQVQTGAFVSIYVNDDLRGCIGRMSSDMPLYKLVQQMTVSAAKKSKSSVWLFIARYVPTLFSSKIYR